MEPLIKITTEPIRIEHFRQNGRLVNSNNVDMERRKALARQASFRSSVGQGPVSVDDINKINRAFSKKQQSAAPQVSDDGSSFQQKLISSQTARPQIQVKPSMQQPASAPVVADGSPVMETASLDAASAPVASTASQTVIDHDFTASAASSYTAQRGAFEMRVAKGELSYLPPMVMTVVTQRPQVHIEYLGGFNYVPPRDESSGNVNLFS